MTRGTEKLKAMRCGVLVLAVLGLAVSSVSAQDAVKLSGLWVRGVNVHSIQKGQVRYQTPSGAELQRSVQHLEGLKLGRYPALAQAQDAADRGDDTAAAALFRQVGETANEPWVRGYARMRLVQALARLDDADAAADVYIDLVVSGAELYFVARPPTDVVAQADTAVRVRVLELAKAALGAVGPQRAALLQQLIDAAGHPSADLLAPEPAGGSGSTDSAIGPALSASVPPGSIVNLYRRGSYDRALRAANEALTQPGKTASRLYLKGMAQLALAEQSGDADGYMSAGLSFMRVLVYFPRSAVAGPAMLEAGYVHQRIGRLDIAQRLYARARPLIDEQEDPVTYRRLVKLIASVSDARQVNK